MRSTVKAIYNQSLPCVRNVWNLLCVQMGHLLMIHYVIISNSISFNPFLAKVPVHKKGSFPLRISLINVTKSTKTADLVTFTEEILNGKLQFLRSVPISYPWKHQEIKDFLLLSESKKWENWPEISLSWAFQLRIKFFDSLWSRSHWASKKMVITGVALTFQD